MNDMKSHLPLKIWFIMNVTLLISALMVRLAWEVTFTTAVGSMVIIALLMLAILSIYSLILYISIKPSLKKLKSRLVRIWVVVITTAFAIGGIIHFVRFVPSPEAAAPLSVVIAWLLLVGGISGYLLILWVVWFILKGKKG